MSIQLSKTNKRSGFTLIELLVVIAIIAILSVIGATIFSGVQRGARDARRQSDIEAIANALEVNKPQGNPTYNVLALNQFAGGALPADTTTAVYCIATTTTATVPVAPTTWATASPCATAPAGYAVVSITNPAATTVSWRLCALLENGTNPTTFCKANGQ